MSGTEPRYLAVAASCAVLHNVTLIAGDLAGLHYVASTAISFVLVVLWGYALHARVTFRVAMSPGSLVRYAITMASTLPLLVALLFVLCDLMGLGMVVAAPIATALLVAWNFAASRWAIAGRLLSPREAR